MSSAFGLPASYKGTATAAPLPAATNVCTATMVAPPGWLQGWVPPPTLPLLPPGRLTPAEAVKAAQDGATLLAWYPAPVLIAIGYPEVFYTIVKKAPAADRDISPRPGCTWGAQMDGSRCVIHKPNCCC